MAVYTQLTQERIAEIVAQYGRGQLRLAVGIAEGVENSNYLIESDLGGELIRSILTVYEKRVREEELPFFLELMQHLARGGIACPVPLVHEGGEMLLDIDGKKAAMITFLNGQSRSVLREPHCRELGRAMAEMHLAAQGMTMTRANDLSLAGWQEIYDSLGSRLNEIHPNLEAEVKAELSYLTAHWPSDLPRGIIHADLFPNNVFFEGEQLSGIIDFYFACEDAFAYELAICMNCWCFEREKEFNVTKAKAMIHSYEAVRRLSDAERAALPTLARGAALRFLLTRAYDWLNHPDGAFVTPLDPMEYAHKLRFLQLAQSPAELGIE